MKKYYLFSIVLTKPIVAGKNIQLFTTEKHNFKEAMQVAQERFPEYELLIWVKNEL